MNRTISGTVSVPESGRPLRGLQVLAARVSRTGLEPLGTTTTGDYGRFRIAYSPFSSPVDLTLLIFSPDGTLLFTEPIHREVSGAELNLRVEIPEEQLF